MKKNEFPYKRLVIAAYRLPFKFVKTKKGYNAIQNAGGLVSAILSLSQKMPKESEQTKIAWIGKGDNMPENISNQSIANKDFDLIPVTIPDLIDSNYYGGFCNNLIWPLFHYFSSLAVIDEKYYEAYRIGNKIFMDRIRNVIKPGDFIWIHDYQLFLLPELIRKEFPDVTVGFFLHIPFPSYEIFRLMPKKWREGILKGMLGADLVGFHTNDYTQHFIKSVKRTVGYECKENFIYTEDRIARADAFPIGIDFDKFHNACYAPPIVKEKNKLKEHITDKKLIFSVDRLDYSKGFINRLNGYEHFLEKYPEWHDKVIFNMVVVPSRDSIDHYKAMKKEIDALVGRINSKYSNLSWRPVIYQYKSLDFDELVALYDLSDVGLITPLRDGMNLVAKEYVACQVENAGVLILSEMAGAASELNDAIIINPSDKEEMSESIDKALRMSKDEKIMRITKMQKRIKGYNVFAWANDFFHLTYHVKKEQDFMSVKFITDEIRETIKIDYLKAKKRLIFIDYDGTLVPFSKYPEAAHIDKYTIEILTKLASDNRNTVVIISGRDKEFLESQLKGLNIRIIAEHGFFTRDVQGQWSSDMDVDLRWKEIVQPILAEYVERCTGTFIEEKYASMAWHYRNAEADFAKLRLIELKDDLTEILKNKTNLTILEGNKVLEIKSSGYDKGTAAKKMILDNNDFIMAVGDDKTDEDLFKALPDNTFTIKIGTKPSSARYNLGEQSDLIKLLKLFCSSIE